MAAAKAKTQAAATLAGRRIAVTRAREQSSELASLITVLGGTVVELPLIQVSKHVDPHTLAEVLAELGGYAVVAFAPHQARSKGRSCGCIPLRQRVHGRRRAACLTRVYS